MIGTFKSFVDGPFGDPGDAANDQNPETLVLANGRREFRILRMACSRFLWIQQNAIRRALCDVFSFRMIRKFQGAAPNGDLQFFRADKGNLRDGADIGCRTNEGVIGKNFHGGSSGGGKNQAAGAKVRLRAIRKAVQSDTAPAGQIEQRARATKLKKAPGLRREAVTVVDRCACGNSGGIEVSGGSLRHDTKRRDSCGARGQRNAHQEKRKGHSKDAAAHTRSKPPREVHCQFRRCVRGCAGTVLQRLLAASPQTERDLSRSARRTEGQAAAKHRAARSDRIISSRWRAVRVFLHRPRLPAHSRRNTLRNIAVTLGIALVPLSAVAQKPAPPAPAQVAREVRDYRMANEERIVRELSEFLSIPNIASDTPNIQRNAAHLVEMLEARGIETHLLPIAGRGPVVFGKLISPGAKRTVIFYAHYDGQPVDAAAWTDGKPFEPALRDAAIEAGGKRIPFPENSAQNRAIYNDNWRIYARSSSDDKSPIVALLAAIDALHAKKIPLAVNLKVIFEGEEEAGSTNLQRTLELHKNLLEADLLITADGPVHQSGRPLVFFGNRGDIGLDITVYGPVRALHSGHYGNWAPNPAMELSRLLASMRDANGRVLIDGYYDDVVPLSAIEKEALSKMPDNDAELERELGIAKPEGGGKKLVELIHEPSLNVRGLRSAYVGDGAQNVVPEKAEASIDARLVKGEDPHKKYQQIVGFIRKQGFYVIDHEPTMDERREHARIAKIVDEGGYRASRTAMDLPVSKALVQVVQDATGGNAVIAPTLGGSVPMYIFEDLGLPWIGVPIVNYDNHQHSSDENLRLGQFWRGIEEYGAILADLNW